jgi:predicted nuclease with TOPRIM domain
VAKRDLDLNALDVEMEGLNYGGGLNAMISRRDTSLTVGTETELSSDEIVELEECEAIIERGLQTFYEVGSALLRVRDLRLYRVEYGTFEEYCAERWSISRPRAYQFIDAAEVRSNLSTMVDIEPPVSERQTRPLARLSPDQQRQAWQAAVQRAKEAGRRITAAIVEAVVKELQPDEPAQNSYPVAHREAKENEPAPTLDPAHETSQNGSQLLPLDQVAQLQREVEQWKQRYETQRQALEAMRSRAVQAETQLEVEQHKVQQLQQELQQLREGT